MPEEANNFLVDISGLGAGGGRLRGGSRLFCLNGSTSLDWKPEGRRIVTGVRASQNSFSVARNGYTWSAINNLVSGAMIGRGLVIFYRENNAVEPASFQGGPEIFVENGETLTVSNGGTNKILIILYFFYVPLNFSFPT